MLRQTIRHLRTSAMCTTLVIGTLTAEGGSNPARAAFDLFEPPGLSYDSATVRLTPGGSVDIGATLTVGSFGLTTDGSGIQTVSNGGITMIFGRLDFVQQLDINSLFYGTPAFLFSQNTEFVPGSHSQLENLNLDPGSSLHLDLGHIVADSALPAGSYTTDIGIDQECSGYICDISPFDPPSFADAGALSVDVAAIPEPPGIALLFAGLLGLFARGSRGRDIKAIKMPGPGTPPPGWGRTLPSLCSDRLTDRMAPSPRAAMLPMETTFS